MKVVLASSSPRRRELLKEIFNDFIITSPDCDETLSSSPTKSVRTIAKRKADSVNCDYDLLISADTVVVYKNQILGKPENAQDAISILTKLSGKIHDVYTGVCLKYKVGSVVKEKVFHVRSRVKMKKMNCDQIENYVKTGSPLDKAGAYGIQDGVVDKYFGSYSNIVGLPMEKLKKELRKRFNQEELWQ